MMLGLLLARRGVGVTVLEKHADFFRDFRGDTVHPSTLQVLHELGLLSSFRRRPHQELRELSARIGTEAVTVADFRHLPVAARCLVIMPQWDFLDFLAGEARRYPNFSLLMGSEVTGLLHDGATVAGVRVATASGTHELPARLVVGADGRHSTVRRLSGLQVRDLGAPIDVLWFRLPRHADDPEEPLGRYSQGRIAILVNRGDYFQCGFVIRKNGLEELQSRGLEAFRALVGQVLPLVRMRTGAIGSWDDVKLLTVTVDRLRTWYQPGLLCLGDAAHAMSPIGGVGINLAIQDAVAAANILAEPLCRGPVPVGILARVERRRRFPTRATQRLQVLLQRVISAALERASDPALPLPLRLLRRFPVLRRIPARIVGLGFRPEHVAPSRH